MKLWKKKWRGLVLTVAIVLFAGSAVHPAILRAAETGGSGQVTTENGKSGPTEPSKNANDAAVSTDSSSTSEGTENPTAPGEDNSAGTVPDSSAGTSTPGSENSGGAATIAEDDGAGGGQGGDDSSTNPDGGDPDEGDGTDSTPPTDPTPPDAGDGDDGDDGGDTTKGSIMVDGQPVDSIVEAWKIAKESGTIKLEDSITTNLTSANAAGPIITRDTDVTLDLNGKTWTFNANSNGQNASGAPDLVQIEEGTLTIIDSSNGKNGKVVYNGSGSYAGACFYVIDGKIKIEDGTFTSNVSAPIYIDGAQAEINGGTFSNTGSGNAITVGKGSLYMYGGTVASGSLTVEKIQSSDVKLYGGTFAKIKVDEGTVTQILGKERGYRNASSSGTGSWITDLDQLTSKEIANVEVDEKPIVSVTVAHENISDGQEIQFSYEGGETYHLTAEAEISSGYTGQTPSYQWECSYNNGERKRISTDQTIDITNKDSAGTYIYYAGVTIKDSEGKDYTEWSESFTITINPITSGSIENKSFPVKYTYGDPIEQPANGSTYFNLINGPTATDVSLTWTYTWYKGGTEAANQVSSPSDAGNYILKVEASDKPNYTASGEIPITISPRTVTPQIEGTTTKVYDGTAEVKDAKIVLDNLVAGDSSRVTATASSFAYNSANASAANRIIASGIKLTGEKAANYVLSSSEASIAGTITKAKLLLNISVEPSTQKINRPVDVSVTASYSDNTPLDNDGLKAENILLTVSGRNDTEEAHTLSMQAAPGQYGVYRTSYTTAIKGDKTFEAVIVGNDNYEVSNAASDNSLTIMDKTGTTMTVTANKTEDIVYGDEVKYTATVSRASEEDTDVFTGNVQFYLDNVESDSRLGSIKPVTTSGEKVSVTVDYNKLTAGEHKIVAVFSATSSFEDATAEVSTSVAKKPLTWDVSELTASKAEGTAGEVTVYGEIKLEGLLEEGDVTVKQPEVLKTNGLKSATAGSYKVTVAPEDGEWEFDPAEPKNYTLPEEEPQITAKVNALKELPNPPEAVDGKTFKLVMEEGISTVPDGLKNTSFNTPAKIEQELKRVLTESGVYKEENVAVYDVVLQVSTDEGATWQEADYTNFPEGGLKVTLPYPSGTGRYTNNFAAAHMFSTSYFGKTSGNVELPAIRKTDNGMEFTVTGLSPIALAWSAPGEGTINASGGVSGALNRILGVATGDGSPILLYAGLAGASALVLVIAVVMITGSRKKRKPGRR